MITLRPFQYVQAHSAQDAVRLLAEYGESARLFAGGTDVLVAMKGGALQPKYLIDIKGISPLGSITQTDQGIDIGALTTLNALIESPLLKDGMSVLADAAETIGSYQVRNRATIGGNLCNASPSADMVPALLCLDASVSIAQAGDVKTVPLDEFFFGPRKTVLTRLGQPAILTHIHVPRIERKFKTVYLKHSVRNALDLAIVGVGVKLEREGNGYAGIRVALGGVAPTPVRARKTEEFLARQQRLDEDAIAEALNLIAGEISPISDVRASAEYRLAMTQLLVKRGLQQTIAALQA